MAQCPQKRHASRSFRQLGNFFVPRTLDESVEAGNEAYNNWAASEALGSCHVVLVIGISARAGRIVHVLTTSTSTLPVVAYFAWMTVYLLLWATYLFCTARQGMVKKGSGALIWSVFAQMPIVISPLTSLTFSRLFFPNGTNFYMMNMTAIMLVQAALLYFPWYLQVVLPFNICVLMVHHYIEGTITVVAVCRSLLLAWACSHIYRKRVSAQGNLYLAKVTAQRALDAAEVWQGAFSCILDSVFDARCVCSTNGTILSSTPLLDQMLLGADANKSLEGNGLLKFARGQFEYTRFENFLADLVRSGKVLKMQFSFCQPRASTADVAGANPPVEVIVSGIAVPHAVEPGSSMDSSNCHLILGFELAGGLEPSDVPAEIMDKVKNATRTGTLIPADAYSSCAEELDMFDVDAHPLFSHQSTPSICGNTKADVTEPQIECDDGDCLPPDVVVWAEGVPLPVKVKDITAGQKVLCYDQVTKSAKYAEVSSAAMDDAPDSHWVVVKLEDGSELKMTADHPMFPCSTGTDATRDVTDKPKIVRARDLDPSLHALEVFKVVRTRVVDVVNLNCDEGNQVPSKRVILSVRHPERHLVFVASRPGAVGALAVGSANLTTPERCEKTPYQSYRVKNTFVELNGSDCASVSRRARSESPKRIQYVANDHRTMQREWNAPVTVRKTLTFTARSKATSHSHASTISSYQTSVASVCTEDGALPAQVIVGTGNAANRFLLGTSVAPAPREIRISQGVMAKVGAFKSLGSIGHHEGWCVPCLMDGWHRKENSADTKACRNGIFCSRCHDDHGAEDLVAVRRLRRQRRRKAGEMARL